MSLEDILRAARKANGEPIGKPASPPSSYNPPPEHDEQDENDKKNWYKKTWCIILFLVIFYPVGLILLWISPRGSFQLKGIVTASIIFSVVYFNVGNSFVIRILYPPPVETERSERVYRSEKVYSTTEKVSTYDNGYLAGGSEWFDGSGNSHYNSKKVKVEITNNTIVTSSGTRLKQIYFLEGNYIGSWGYTRASYLSYDY